MKILVALLMWTAIYAQKPGPMTDAPYVPQPILKVGSS
jgi:hypothetical protein